MVLIETMFKYQTTQQRKSSDRSPLIVCAFSPISYNIFNRSSGRSVIVRHPLYRVPVVLDEHDGHARHLKNNLTFVISVQGDLSGSTQPPVDTKTKVVF